MKIRTIYPVVVVPLLGVIIVTAMLLLYLSPFTHATSATPRIILANTVSADSICKGTAHCKLISAAPANQPIALALGLKLRNTDNLSAYLREITNPASPLYHHYLNAASFAAQYGPFPQSEASVGSFSAISWLQDYNHLRQSPDSRCRWNCSPGGTGIPGADQ